MINEEGERHEVKYRSPQRGLAAANRLTQERAVSKASANTECRVEALAFALTDDTKITLFLKFLICLIIRHLSNFVNNYFIRLLHLLLELYP